MSKEIGNWEFGKKDPAPNENPVDKRIRKFQSKVAPKEGTPVEPKPPQRFGGGVVKDESVRAMPRAEHVERHQPSGNKFVIEDATPEGSYLRLVIYGGWGSGKTETSLNIATKYIKPLIKGKNDVLVLDTEHRSSVKYAMQYGFKVLHMPDYHPQTYIDALAFAAEQGYQCVVIDSLSHEWVGEDGVLALTHKATQATKSQNSYFAWGETTPLHNAFLEAIMAFPGHIIATVRAKQDYAIDNVGGKSVPRRIGLAPVQRDGNEYIFDIIAEMDADNNTTMQKSRAKVLRNGDWINPFKNGQMFAGNAKDPGGKMAAIIVEWLSLGGQVDKPVPQERLDKITEEIIDNVLPRDLKGEEEFNDDPTPDEIATPLGGETQIEYAIRLEEELKAMRLKGFTSAITLRKTREANHVLSLGSAGTVATDKEALTTYIAKLIKLIKENKGE